MAFQFNFDIEQDSEEQERGKANSRRPIVDYTFSASEQSKTKELNVECSGVSIVRPARELITSPTLTIDKSHVDSLRVGDIELCFLDPVEVEIERKLDSIQNDSDVSRAMESHTDLIPNVYEGGLKVWECSIDLVNFLHESEVSMLNKRVLELGCGAGLPGILAVKQGASVVHFQDYNDEVIEHMTIPSVMLNKSDDALANQEVRFFSGDWSLVQEMLEKYDIILTSETIYSVESHDKLYKILRALLRPTGVIYIAAKTHYFGVGGGTRIFEDVVRQHGEFHIEVCKTFTEGVKREILKMEFVEASKNL